MTDTPPRVLIVAPLYHTDRGGLGRQAVLLTERLAELGAKPLVATRAMTGLPPRAFSPKVERAELSAGRPETHNYEETSLLNLATSLRFSARLLALMARRRGDYDVIHVHGASLPFLIALPAAKLLRRRIVGKVAALHQGVEAGDLAGHYGPLGRVLAWIASRSDAFVATTAEIGAALGAEGVPLDRIARIPNFVDTRRFHPADRPLRDELRRERGWEDRTVLIHSGRLSERKNGDILLKAFARASRAVPDANALLVFAGDGPQRTRLEALSKELDLQDRVAFAGFQNAIERELQAADLLVLASRVEGLPNALLEGMACGLPAVVTRIGGSLEAAIEGETALFVPANEEDALATALQEALADPALRTRLGAAAKQRIQARFTLDAVAPHYLELYRRLSERRPPAGASLAKE
ncbi:MAG: glycosyltransferase family 4 protein [Planctomycetes bacterium]|nr:glycosyltransferase family 4 protein [Planctomycetota bacterium]